jgi:hypothetical protein
MGTPPLHKNGQEQAYKQELRALRETLEKDAEAHVLILAKLNVYETEIKVANARSEEKDKAESTLRRLARSITRATSATATRCKSPRASTRSTSRTVRFTPRGMPD